MSNNKDESEAFKERWRKFPNVMVEIMWLSDWAGNVGNIRAQSDFHNPIENSERVACSDLWFKMQIGWQGDVALCCFDSKNTVNVGDLSIESLRKVWHSKPIQELRRHHIQKRYSGICEKCLDWATPDEYEFWYSDEELHEEPESIWYKHLNLKN